MEKDEYISEVLKVLDSHSAEIKRKFEDALDSLPPKTVAVDVNVFSDQDGEGFLNIRVSLDGPDLYVLNREIKKKASLFDTVMGSDGFEPPLPVLDPFDVEFESADTLVDTATRWLQKELSQTNLSKVNLPITILNPEGYGTVGAIKLNG